VPQDLQDVINKYGGKMPQTWGVPVEEIQRGIKHGVRKINVDTDNRLAMTGAIRRVLQEKPGAFDPRDDSGPFSRYSGADDYLHQAADPMNRPKGLAYDPEGDGVPITASLGVHEHWSDPVKKKYSGPGKGIDLVYIE